MPALGFPKISNLVGRIFHSYLCRFAAVIDQREKRDAFGLQNSLQLLDYLVYRVITRDIDQSIAARSLHRHPKSFSIASPLTIEICWSCRSPRKALISYRS